MREEIAKRELAKAVKAQRDKLEGQTLKLKEALGRIKARDAQAEDFDKAEEALGDVRELLVEGSGLETKEPKYDEYAGKLRARLQKQRTFIERKRVEFKVREGRAALTAASRGLKDALKDAAKRATEEAFDEVSKAWDALAALIDKGAQLKAKDKRYARQLTSAKSQLQRDRKRLIALKRKAKLDRQRGEVAEALAALNEARKGLKAKLVDSATFSAAEEAIKTLRDKLEEGKPFEANAGYRRYATKAAKLAQATVAQIEKTKLATEVAEQRAKLESAREALKSALSALRSPTAEKADFEAAKAAQKALEDETGAAIDLASRDRKFRTYLKGVRAFASKAISTIEQGRMASAVADQQTKVESSLERLAGAMQKLDQPDATGADLDAAVEAFDAVTAALRAGEKLAGKAKAYARYERGALRSLRQARDRFTKRKTKLTFKTKVISGLKEGREQLFAGAQALDARARVEAYDKARTLLQTCREEGQRLIQARAGLARQRFEVGGRKLKGSAIIAQCKESDEAATKAHMQAEADLAFYDGPAKQLADGLVLMQKAGEAAKPDVQRSSMEKGLKAFEECVVSAGKLGYKRPDLKKKKFEMDGGAKTLEQVRDKCREHAKSARTKLGAS